MPKKRGRPPKVKNVVQNSSVPEIVQNNSCGGIGLGGGVNFGGFPANQGAPFSESISNVNTTFVNLRWYLVSNFRQFLSELYVEIGLVQTIVDVPVEDGLRGGIEIKSKQLEEEQVEELVNSLDRDDDLNIVGQAAKWNRLFGGAGILVLTDQDPELPLDLDAIKEDTPLEFRAVDMWELFWDKQNTEGYDPAIQSEDFEYYNYYGEQVHKSRVMRLKGFTAPSFIRPRLRGWGFSVVECLIRSINQYLRATDVTFEVLDEFKLDIFKVKNLVNTLLSPQGAQQIQARVAQTNYTKNYQNAIVMDSEDDYVQKQLSFAGLSDAMAQIRMQVAADMRMPLTKLFGISAAGFNSGEDDIEVYNAMVESQVRNKLKYDILRICEIKCQKLFGFVPDDLSLNFKPLRVLSSEQEEGVKTQKFNRLLAAKQSGEISTEEFRDACNRGNLFDIKLDNMDLAIGSGGYMADRIQEGSNNPRDPLDIDNPGADRLDTEKSRATEVGGIGKEPVDKQQPAPRSSDAPKDLVKTKAHNSERFDRASYEADGGDNWIADGRKYFFENPKDRGLWRSIVEESKHLFSDTNWKFATWLYLKRGGKFNAEEPIEEVKIAKVRTAETEAPIPRSADLSEESANLTATSKSKKRLQPPLTGYKTRLMTE